MDLVSLAKNPIPSGAKVGTFAGYDSKPMRYAIWNATRGPRRGTICLFHGRGEFIEKYFETIADLRRRGFAVATMDWRGQGGSYRKLGSSRKGHITDFAEYDKDLLRFMKDIVLPDCPPPFHALAHSMGGNILLRTAVQQGSWFERMILSAPMITFAEERVGVPQSVARAYAETGSLIGLSKLYVHGGGDGSAEMIAFEGNPLTSDRERWSRNKAILEVAPELGLGSPTIGWLRAAYRSSKLITEPSFATRIMVPMMLLAAGDDTIVSTRAIEDFAVQLKVGSHILIPGARHEILQENDFVRQRFWAAFDAYLRISSIAA